MITSVMEVYELAEKAIRLSRQHGDTALAADLDRALSLGSSPLEILGAVRAAFVAKAPVLEQLLGKAEVADVVSFVDKAYGR